MGWPEGLALGVAVLSAFFAWRSDQRAGRAENRAASAEMRALQSEERERVRHEAEMERHERERAEALESRRAHLHLEVIASSHRQGFDGIVWHFAELLIRNTGPADASDFRVWLGDEDVNDYSTVDRWDGVLTRDDRDGHRFRVRVQDMYMSHAPDFRWTVVWADGHSDDNTWITDRRPLGGHFTEPPPD